MASRILSLQGRLELWAEHAHDLLTETAQVVHLAITDADLARLVQERSGEASDMPHRSWLPKVLRIVAQRADEAGEPALTSLVVRSSDQKVGPDFDAALALDDVRPATEAQREELAAQARLDCYRRYAQELPEGLEPNLHPITSLATDPRGERMGRAETPAKAPRVRAPRPSRATKPVVEEKEPQICTRCFLQLPLNGICPNCS